MSKSSIKKIVVAGDAAIDWFLFPVDAQDAGDNWRLRAAMRPTALPGGALLLGDFVREAVTALHADAQVFAPVIPLNLNNIPPEQLIHSNAMLEFFKLLRQSPAKDRVRVKESLGFVGPASGTPDVPRCDPDPADADILVLDDAGNGFRDQPQAWPTSLRSASAGTPLIVHKICRPIAAGEIWHEITNRHADRHIVIVNADDLRSIPGVDLSRSLSWERTAKDFVYQIMIAQELQSLRSCAYLLVLFGVDGAVIYRGGQQAEAVLIFDPGRLEGGFANSVEGRMYGLTSVFTAAVVSALAQQGVTQLYSGVKRGLAWARALLQEGFHREGAGLAYPTKKICLSEDVQGFASCRIERPHDLNEADKSFWRILDQQTRNTRRIVAEDLIVRGRSDGLAGVPIGKFGNLETIDRAEIESYSAIRELIVEYLNAARPPRPLSFAVFGPPGSGKSFGVKQVLKSVGRDNLQTLTFNVSQFRQYRDLVAALHKVRDVALAGMVPFVFFDEFDSANDDGPLGWLKYFLAPMQDGEFRDADDVHPVGKAIFVFAGGTRSSFSEFSQGKAAGVDEQAKQEFDFKDVKGPDFVSRLRGYIDVMGPNRQEAKGYSDEAFIIRRAKVVRAMLRGNPKSAGMFDSEGKLRIDAGVLRALLNVTLYKHGTRSVEAILDMSRLHGKQRFDLACLPPRDQLDLHVDADEFLFLARKERFYTILCDASFLPTSQQSVQEFEKVLVEAAARRIHEDYVMHRQLDGKTGMMTVAFDELSPEKQNSNRDAAAHIPRKLRSINQGMRKIAKAGSPCTPDISDEDVERLARLEHDRWCAEEVLQGCEYSEQPIPGKRTSPYLKPYEQLPKEIQQYDVQAIHGLPRVLRDLGYEIVRMEEVDELEDPALIETLARAHHATYLRERKQEGDSPQMNAALVDFDQLPPDLMAANLDSVSTIPRKLRQIGYGIRPVLPGTEPPLLQLSDDEINRLGQLEHARWNWQKILQGWSYRAGKKNADKKTTPYLVPWKDLSPEIQHYDIEQVCLIPQLLQEAGYEAYLLNSEQ